MEFEIHQSEIDEIRETLPLADILIDAILTNAELSVTVIPNRNPILKKSDEKEI